MPIVKPAPWNVTPAHVAPEWADLVRKTHFAQIEGGPVVRDPTVDLFPRTTNTGAGSPLPPGRRFDDSVPDGVAYGVLQQNDPTFPTRALTFVTAWSMLSNPNLRQRLFYRSTYMSVGGTDIGLDFRWVGSPADTIQFTLDDVSTPSQEGGGLTLGAPYVFVGRWQIPGNVELFIWSVAEGKLHHYGQSASAKATAIATFTDSDPDEFCYHIGGGRSFEGNWFWPADGVHYGSYVTGHYVRDQELYRLLDDPFGPFRRASRVVVIAPAGSVTLSPGSGSLVFTGAAPTVSTDANVELAPGAGSLVLSGAAPSVTEFVVVGSGALVFTGAAPSVIEAVDVPSAGLVFIGTPPAVIETVAPASGSLAYQGQAPTIEDSDTLTVDSGSLVYAGHVPTITVDASVTAEPGFGSLVYTGAAPAVDETVPIAAGSLVFVGSAPTIVETVPVPAASVVFGGVAPSVIETVTVAAGGVRYNSFAPTVIAPATLTVNAGSLVYTGAAPTVIGRVLDLIAPYTAEWTDPARVAAWTDPGHDIDWTDPGRTVEWKG